MFGRKKEPKVKEPSAREIQTAQIAEQMEGLALGQILIYKLPEIYWSGFAAFIMVEVNPSYPKKGRKYIASTDKMGDGGKPAGQKGRAFDSNKARDISSWIAEKSGVAGQVSQYLE